MKKQKAIPASRQGFIQIILTLVVVAIIGAAYYFETLKNKPNVVTETPTEEPIVTETSKPSEDPTANWKTYTNTKMKLSLKYPSDEGLEIFTSSSNELNFSMNVEKYSPLFLEVALLPNTTIEKWYEMAYSSAKQKTEVRPVLLRGPNIDGISSFYSDFIQQGSGFVRQLYVQTGNNLYQFVIPTTDNSVQYQILSTFKFTK